MFDYLVPPRARVEGRSPFIVHDVPKSVKQRTLVAADSIAAGSIEIFGRTIDVADVPEWHNLIDSEGTWPNAEWWRIDLRSDARLGDVKWAWEFARHRHLVILARAAWLDPTTDVYLETLTLHLESWLVANPPERGVHWYSNLEISLRALAWLQILALVGDRFDEVLRSGMWRHLHHSGRHVIADLPYTVSTMRNNHLLGDALGLVGLGKAFGADGRRWLEIGDRIFNRQTDRLVRSDGSMVEDSISYHRFVLEMLTMRVVLGGASVAVRSAMVNAAQYLARLGADSGAVPQIGDWDEGRVLAVATNPRDLEGSVFLALALGGEGAFARWRSEHDEAAWFTEEGEPIAPEPPTADGGEVGGGTARAAAGEYVVWLKAGSGPSHGHADLTSVAIRYRGEMVVGDPGTGTYNGLVEVRNHFRSSEAHNVLLLDGEDQLVPHRAFRWRHSGSGAVGVPLVVGETIVMWGFHDAYRRLEPARRVVRVVAVDSGGVEIADFVEGQPVGANLSVQLAPGAAWHPEVTEIGIGGERLSFVAPGDDTRAMRGTDVPYAGWWSETYGAIEPATVLSHRLSTGFDPIMWGVRSGDRESGRIVPIVKFHSGCVELTIEKGQERVVRRLAT